MGNAILVIDDDELITLTLQRALRRWGYDVTVVHSGLDGVQQARRLPPDLIVLDVMMPGMNGFDVCREMRADDRLKDIPVLFLTARSDQADRIEGFLSGGDDYLTKPFSLEELNLRIKAILRRVLGRVEEAEEPGESDVIQVGDVVLNCRTFLVRTEKGDNLLTNVQFDLLYHLMVHAGKVFSTQQLLQAVWNYPPNTGSPELVRAHIRNLREKIETQPSNPRHICTVQGHGYTFRA